MDILSFLGEIIVIFALSLIALFTALPFISNRISLIGLYHKLQSPLYLGGEKFRDKVMQVTKCNFMLAFPILFAFYILITQNIPNCDAQKVFFVSIGISLVTLLILRVLANPCELLRPLICDRDGEHSVDHVRTHKERTLSFFYAIIGGSLIIIIGIFSYDLLEGVSFEFPPLAPWDYVIVLILFIVFILVVSLVGEILLYLFQPIDQLP
jgi:hypothetical protein